jgi:hypothetical protein
MGAQPAVHAGVMARAEHSRLAPDLEAGARPEPYKTKEPP